MDWWEVECAMENVYARPAVVRRKERVVRKV